MRRIIDEMEGTHRLLIHGRVNPNQEGDLAGMDELAEKWGVSAWKCYTQWGPDGRGFFLHDEATGLRLIEKARALGVRNICIHKGLPFGRRSYEHSLASDIGIVAKMFPDVNFLVYHSGFVPGRPEGPYDPAAVKASTSLSGRWRRTRSRATATFTPSWAAPGAIPCAIPTARPISSASWSSISVRRTFSMAPIASGTARPRIRYRRSARSRISSELQEKYGYAKMTPTLRAADLRAERGQTLWDRRRRGSEKGGSRRDRGSSHRLSRKSGSAFPDIRAQEPA